MEFTEEELATLVRLMKEAKAARLFGWWWRYGAVVFIPYGHARRKLIP